MICSKCNEPINIPPPNMVGFTSIEYICLKCSGTLNDSSHIKTKFYDPNLGLKFEDLYKEEKLK